MIQFSAALFSANVLCINVHNNNINSHSVSVSITPETLFYRVQIINNNSIVDS